MVKALAEPVYLNGELPNPQAGEPLAIVDDELAPVDVVTINEQVVQVDAADGLRVSVSAVTPDGELLPVDPTGKIIVEKTQRFFVSGKGFAGGSEVVIWIFSTPRRLGLLPVSPDGKFEGNFEIDESIELGNHTVQVNGLDTAGTIRSVNLDLEVQRPSSALAPLAPTSNTDGQSGYLWWYGLAFAVCGSGVLLIATRRRRRSDQTQ
jgi:hypothetical protein